MTEVCTRADFAGQVVGAPCPECGHANIAHIGAKACVICELVALGQDPRGVKPPPAGDHSGVYRVAAREIESAGNIASGLDLSEIGQDGHDVANRLWAIAGYLRRRGSQ